jgi:uncharacterized protein HemX
MMRVWVALLLVLALSVGGCATVDPQQDVRIEAEVKARRTLQNRLMRSVPSRILPPKKAALNSGPKIACVVIT